MATEIDNHDDDYCPDCWAGEVALKLLDTAIWNCIAAHVDVDIIEAAVAERMAKLREAVKAGELDATSPVGNA